ncbi:hypothetical protein MASR2M70_13660 [Bacillota bacterium]
MFQIWINFREAAVLHCLYPETAIWIFDKYINNSEYTEEQKSDNSSEIAKSDYDYAAPGFTGASKVRVYIDNST